MSRRLLIKKTFLHDPLSESDAEIAHQSSDLHNVSVYYLCESFNFNEVLGVAELESIDFVSSLPNEETIVFKPNSTESTRLLVVFNFGIVVFWDFSAQEEGDIIKLLEKAMYGKLAMSAGLYSSYQNKIVATRKKLIQNDIIFLKENSPDEKTFISYALAQDLFLDRIAQEVEGFMTNFKILSRHLVKFGNTDLKPKQVYKIIGNIFLLLNKITYKKGIFDMPDYDFEQYQASYDEAQSYLNISTRVEDFINNTKLILDFYHIIYNDVDEQRGTNRDLALLFLVVMYSAIHFMWNVVLK